MFAESIGAPGWVLIIGAVFLGLTNLAGLVFAFVKERAKTRRDELVADRVEAVRLEAIKAATLADEVKTTLETATARQDATAARQDEKLDEVAAKVEEVHRATNSLTDRLVESTAAEALARGGVEERARADKRAESKP